MPVALVLAVLAQAPTLDAPAEPERFSLPMQLLVGTGFGAVPVLVGTAAWSTGASAAGIRVGIGDRPFLFIVASGLAVGQAVAGVWGRPPSKWLRGILGPLVGLGISALAIGGISDPHLRAAVASPVMVVAPYFMTLLVEGLAGRL